MPGRAHREGRAVKLIETHTPSITREPIPLDKYPKGYLAILDREIIDHDLSFPRLVSRMRRKGLYDDVTFMGIPQDVGFPRRK
jgi:hypothetical protein